MDVIKMADYPTPGPLRHTDLVIVCAVGHPLRDEVMRANATPYCFRCARARTRARSAARRARRLAWNSS